MDGDIQIKQEYEYGTHNGNGSNIKMEVEIPYLDAIVNNDVKLENYDFDENLTIKTETFTHGCEFCASTFDNRYDLLKHNLTHLRVQIIQGQHFQCDKCDVYFINKQSLIKHLSKHGNTKRTDSYYECRQCKKMYHYKHWMSHLKEVHGSGCFKCDICNIYFKCQRYLNRHQLKHNACGSNFYNCKSCETVFQDRKALNFHVSQAHRNLSLHCNTCSKFFFTRQSLSVHLKSVHTTGEFRCDLCPSYFKCDQYLKVHKRRVHFNDGRQHVCAICGKGFKSPRYMNVHIKNSHFKNEFRTENNIHLVGGNENRSLVNC